MTDIGILQAELLNNQNPLHCTRKELCDAVDHAEEALEKQIPQLPTCYFDPIYKCPTCGDGVQVTQTLAGILVHADKFCRNCGQALIEVKI